MAGCSMARRDHHGARGCAGWRDILPGKQLCGQRPTRPGAPAFFFSPLHRVPTDGSPRWIPFQFFATYNLACAQLELGLSDLNHRLNSLLESTASRYRLPPNGLAVFGRYQVRLDCQLAKILSLLFASVPSFEDANPSRRSLAAPYLASFQVLLGPYQLRRSSTASPTSMPLRISR